MAQVPAPRLVALLLCNSVIEDIRTRNKSYIGVFNTIAVEKVPFQMPLLTIVVILTECRGTQEFVVEISYDSDEGQEKKPLQLVGRLDSVDPLGMVELVFELRGFPIEKMGRYTIRVTSKDTGIVIGYRYFQVAPIVLKENRQ